VFAQDPHPIIVRMQQSIAILERLTMNMVSGPEVVEKKKHHQNIRYGLDLATFAYGNE
jgi:hypothetical protein